MSLDTRYVPLTPYFQIKLFDKNTGAPLTNGKVKFFKDQDRTELTGKKEVFQLSNSAPDYEFTSLGSELRLSINGTFIDESGKEIVVYGYPYDTNLNTELYYCVVENEDGEQQFVREAFPSVGSQSGSDTTLKNYIPNGQFLIHNNLPDGGKITEAGETVVAHGGWIFNRQTNLSADFVVFTRIGSYTDNPTASPRYYADISCTTPNSGDSTKSLSIRYNDVNKFASLTQYYTLYFEAKGNASAPVAVSIKIRKYFGIGGSPAVETEPQTLVIPASLTKFNIPFIFGINDQYTIGSNNDDYVEIKFEVPASYPYALRLTNVALVDGNVELSKFPQTTNQQMQVDTLQPEIPSYDQSNLNSLVVLGKSSLSYPLTHVLGEEGLTANLPAVKKYNSTTKQYYWAYDDSRIGHIVDSGLDPVNIQGDGVPYGMLQMDGTQYDRDGVDPDEGIPYKRLADKLLVGYFEAFRVIPVWGTGKEYVTSSGLSESPPVINVVQNSIGVTTPAADGLLATGFTFSHIAGTDSGFKSFFSPNGLIYIESDMNGNAIGDNNAGDTGFSFKILKDGDVDNKIKCTMIVNDILGLQGAYFKLANSITQYYFWMQVDGIGTDPAPGGTGVLISLMSSMELWQVTEAISNAVNGFDSDLITFVNASAIPAGAWFNFYTSGGLHYVLWFKKDGTGIAPVVSGATKIIECDITNSMAAKDLIHPVMTLINKQYFLLPDMRGCFPRWLTGMSDLESDPDSLTRLNMSPGSIGGNRNGSWQAWQIQSHSHEIYNSFEDGGGSVKQGDVNKPTAHKRTSETGGNQTNPINVYVNPLIYY